MRSVWFAAGAGAGIYLVVKARHVAEALTPEGVADRLSALGVGAHLFAEEVRAGMAQRETELREQLGLALDAPRARTRELTDTTAGSGVLARGAERPPRAPDPGEDR